MIWHDRPECRSGAVCGPCRKSERFRQDIVRHGWAAERDFACPWGQDPPVLSDGPGTKLARLLHRLGFRQSARCQCRMMIERMNWGGPQWCREHLEEILAAMRLAADDPLANPLRLPFVEWAARRLVEKVIG